MKRREATAKRYARSLLVLAREAGTMEPVGQELERVSKAVFAHRELTNLLLRPWIGAEVKRAVVGEVSRRLDTSKLVGDFFGLLATRGRIDHLPDILRVYRELVDDALGRVRATVRSPVALSEAEQETLGAKLGLRIGKQVIVTSKVDGTLLGGFVARIGSRVLDGSLDGQLAQLRDRLVKG